MDRVGGREYYIARILYEQQKKIEGLINLRQRNLRSGVRRLSIRALLPDLVEKIP